jgi:tetratricopeptide (TPR) repeat protein
MNRKQRRIEQKLGGCATHSASQSVQFAFSAGYQHQQAGRLEDAERCYRRVLALDPNHPDSLHLLGVVALQSGRSPLALSMIRRAIEADSQVASYHSNLGTLLADLGQTDQAIECYRRAIALRPDLPEAHVNLGNVLRDRGQTDEARVCYGRAIDLQPNVAEAHVNLGNLLRDQGESAASLACYRRAVLANPKLPEAHNNLGAALRELGSLDEAAASCRTALTLDPQSAPAHANLANVLREQGRLGDAVGACRRALALQPDFAGAMNTLASALTDQGRLDEALGYCRQAVDLQPDYAEAHSNLGNILRAKGQTEEALACYRHALDLKPDLLEAHNNLGNLLRAQGRLADAIACYRRALRLNPDHAEAHNNLAMALLAQGDLPAGWQEYEWRWRTAEMRVHRRDFTQPQWRGQPSAGATLLVHPEQGFGDTLQFSRYVALAQAAGLMVILEVQKPLMRLLRGQVWADRVVALGDPLPPFDLHCPMLSLPLALGTNVTTIPTGPYLRADSDLVAHWRERVGAMPDQGFRVGLAWAGNPRSHSPSLAAVDRRRSIAPQRLAALFDVEAVTFFSLQKGGPAAPAEFPIIDLMSEINDFADTAALIANLDLVISIDSAVAHLAAALGKPVWLMDRSDPCWRWFTGRRDSPWYPTLRLYRQPRPDGWESVVTDIVSDLQAAVRAGAATPEATWR